MKKNALLSLLVLASVAVLGACDGAEAQAHDVDLDDRARSWFGNSSAPLDCYLYAQDETMLNDDQALRLCAYAPSATGPVDCFLAAEDELLRSDWQNVELCRCASSIQPVVCFERAEDASFITPEKIEQLCAPISAEGLRRNCRPDL